MSEGVPQFSYSLNLSFNDSCSNNDPAGSRLQYVKINNDNTIKTNSASPLALVNTAVPQALQQVLTHFGVKRVLPTENSSTLKEERSTNDETFSNFQKIQDYSILNSTSYPNVSNVNTVRKIKIKRNKEELKKKQNKRKSNERITKYIKRLEVTHKHKKVQHLGETCNKLKSEDDHSFNESEEIKNIVPKDSVPQESYDVLKNSNETGLIIPPCTDKSPSKDYADKHKNKEVNETGNKVVVINKQMIKLKEKSSLVDSHPVKKKRKHEEFCDEIQRKQKKYKKKCLSENIVNELEKGETDNLLENIDDSTNTNENARNSNCDGESIPKHNSAGNKEEINRTNVTDMELATIDGNNEKTMEAHEASGHIEQIIIKKVDKADEKTSRIQNFEVSNSENINMNDELKNTAPASSVMNENAEIGINFGKNKSDIQCENIPDVTLNDNDDPQVHNIEKHNLVMLNPEKQPIQELIEGRRKRKKKYKSSETDALDEKSEKNTETGGLPELVGDDIQSELDNEEDSNIIEPMKDAAIIENDQGKQMKENAKPTHSQKQDENVCKTILNSEESDIENIHINDELRNIPHVESVINENVEIDNNLEEDKSEVQCENISDVTLKNINLTEGISKEYNEIMDCTNDKVDNLSPQIHHDHNTEKHDSDMLETEKHPTEESLEGRRKRKKNHKPSETDVSDAKFEEKTPPKKGVNEAELYNEDDSNIIEPIKDATLIEDNQRKEWIENKKPSCKLTKNIIEKEPVKKETEVVEMIMTEEINIKSDNEGIDEEYICEESGFIHEHDEQTEEELENRNISNLPYRIDSPKDDQNNRNQLNENSEQSMKNISDKEPIKKASEVVNIISTEEIDIKSENEEFLCKETGFFHQDDEQTEENHDSNNLRISCQIDSFKDAKNVNIIDVRVITTENENIKEELVGECGLKTSVAKEILIQHRSNENQDDNEKFISQYKNNTQEDKTSKKRKKKRMLQDEQTVEQKTELKAHSISNIGHLSTEHTDTNLKTDDEAQIDNNNSEIDELKTTICEEFIEEATNTDEEKKPKSQKKKQKLAEDRNENSHSKKANEEASEANKTDVIKKTPKNSKRSKNKLVQTILMEEINSIKSSDNEKIELMSGCKSNKKIKINVSRLCNKHNSVKDQKPAVRKKKQKKLFDTNADSLMNFENSADNTSLQCSNPGDKNTINLNETLSILDRQTGELTLNAIKKQSTKQMKKYEAQEQKNEEIVHPNNELNTEAESICEQRDNLNESTSLTEKISTTQKKVKRKIALEEKESSSEKVNKEANSNKKHIDLSSCSKKKMEKACDKKEKKKPKSKIQLDERVSNILSEKFKSFFNRLASQDTEDKKTTNKSSSKSQDETDEVKNEDISEQEKISTKKSKSSTQGGKIDIGEMDLESEEDPEEEYRMMQSYVLSAEESSPECGDKKDSKDQKKKKKSSHKSQDKDDIEEPEKNSPKKSKSPSSIDAVPNKSQSKNVEATKITNDDIDFESEEDPEEEYRKMQSYVLSAEDSSSEFGDGKDSKDKKKKKSSHKLQDEDVIEEPEKNSLKKSKSSSSIDDVPNKSQSKNVQATKITNDDIDFESEEDPEEEYRKMQSYVLSAEDSSSECEDRNNLKDKKKKKKSSHKSQDKDVIEEPEKNSPKKSKSSSSIDDVPNKSQPKNVQATKITNDEINLESEEEYRKMQSYVSSAEDSSFECGDRKDSKDKKKKKSKHKSQDKDVIEEPEKNSLKKSKSSSSIDDVPNKSQPKNVKATKITNDDIDLESEDDPEEEYRKMQSYVLSAEDSSSECGDRKDSKDKKKKKSKHKSQDKDVIEEPEKISSKKSKPSPSTDDVSNNSQSKNVQATKITIDEIDLESEDDPDEEYRKMQSYVISDQDSSSERGDRKDSKNVKKRKKSPDEVITEQQEKISSKKSKPTSIFDTNSSNFHSSNKMKGKTTHHQFDTESSDENPEMIYREMQSYSMSHKSSTGDCSDKSKKKNKNDKTDINIEDMDIVFQEDSELEQNKSNDTTHFEVEPVGGDTEIKNAELQKHTEVPAIIEFTPSLSFEQIEINDSPMDKSTLPNTGNHTCLRSAKVNNDHQIDVNYLNDDMDLEPFPVFELDNGRSESFQFSPMKSSTYINSIKNLPSSDSENDTSVSLRNTMGNAVGIKRSEKEAVLRRDKCRSPSPSKNNEIIEIQTSTVTFIPNDFRPMKEIDITDFDQSAIENDANDRNRKSSKQNSKISITTKEDSSADFSSEENITTNISKNKPKTTKTRREQQRKSAENKKTAKESSTDYDQSAVENETNCRNKKSTSKHNSTLSKATEEDSSADSSSEENATTNISKNKAKTTKTRREQQRKSTGNEKTPKESSTDYDQSAVENETNDRNKKSTSKHNSKLSKATEEDSSADFSSEENIKTDTSNNKPKTTKARREQQRKSADNKKTPEESSADDRIKKRKRSESKIKRVQKKNKVSIDDSARKNGSILAFFSKQKKDNGSKVTKDSSQNQNEASVIRNTESPTDGEQNGENLNVSIPNDEKDNSFSFADILSQSHSKRLEKEVEDILDKTSGAEKSSNSDRGSHLNYPSSSEDDPPTPKKKVLEHRDPREGEPHRNTENIKSINTGRKFSSISKDEQDLIEKRKKKKIIKLIKESKTLWEIRKTLEMDENDEYMKKIKELVIENPYPLTRIQRNSPSIINPPNNVIKEILEKKGIELKLGHFSQEEDVMIEESWNKFCELHNWDVNDLFPFLNCPSKSLHSVLTHKQLASFVQFISYGFKNRTMDNVYSRFQRIFSSKDRNNERFTKEDDKIIMLYKQTAESSRPFAEIGMILNRKRDAVMRRYHLLQRNKHMEQYKIQWNKALTEKFLVALIEVTCSINLAELKNRNITPQEWTQVGERMKLPAIKLKRSWMLNFYPRFFTNRYSKNIVNTTEKLVDIVSAKYSNWSEVDWGAVSDELGKDLPRSKCSKIVRDLVKNKVPLELRNNLNESMKYLSLQELKSGPDNFSFVRKILKETKNGTILPVINEDKV